MTLTNALWLAPVVAASVAVVVHWFREDRRRRRERLTAAEERAAFLAAVADRAMRRNGRARDAVARRRHAAEARGPRAVEVRR